MALILPVKNISPTIPDSCWLAPNSTLVGDLQMGENCTVWFNAVVRADVNAIRIGQQVNIQDGAVIHCTYNKTQTIIGNHVSIGHNAIIHGCQIEDEVLIGMGAIVMDGAKIGKNAIIGAGAIVTQNTVVPAGTIWVGNPAKYLKDVSEEATEVFMRTSNNYVLYSSWFKED
ncbi:gamma carbonic anhydrase family protein [Marinilongibacter aquaticus]|uniref:gamma carbonic anhydrase family protein n=1 Tax=Marinilongibacter aquaticus TaxID=2975157 RepID=UPI0021BD28D6|nr:gamma carbonic anhydrase family protein [Marinilongibacter aquaticus]UBM60346.1 gamma carbonic anhydrase family protein [Marinilongibacter aquaticus]